MNYNKIDDKIGNMLEQMFQTTEERNAYEKEAVDLRESGQPEKALQMIQSVIAWDSAHDNTLTERGVDVFGHLSITYKLLGDKAQTNEQKIDFYRNAVEASERALTLNEEMDKPSIGLKAIHNIHLASRKAALANVLDEDLREPIYLEALNAVDIAIKNLPGSMAHKAWPANIKANILIELPRHTEALETIATAEQWINEGRDEELKNKDGEMKLKIWETGLWLTKARIYKEQGDKKDAELWANKVLAMEDTNNILGIRKDEANRFLTTLQTLALILMSVVSTMYR